MHDVAIIGTGPAGYTAALYTARYKLDVIQIGEEPGGMIAEAPEVCNFPTYKSISGTELTDKMEQQVKDLGVEVKYQRVEKIGKKKSGFKIRTNQGTYKAKKVILATGQKRRKLGLDKEEKFIGRGVSYCVTCDAPFYEGEKVGVIGGGDAALAGALYLTDYAEKVYVLYRRDEFFRPEPIRIERVKRNDKVEPVFNVNVEKLRGKDELEAVELDNGEVLDMKGLFIEIGSVPNSELARDLGVELTEKGYIKIDEMGRTNVKGVYAAGDVTESLVKQATTAVGEGTTAAVGVYEDLEKETNI